MEIHIKSDEILCSWSETRLSAGVETSQSPPFQTPDQGSRRENLTDDWKVFLSVEETTSHHPLSPSKLHTEVLGLAIECVKSDLVTYLA